MSEKIFTRASGNDAHANDFVMADIDYAMAHDGTSVLAVRAFREMGVEKVWDADKIVIPFDHLVPAGTEVAAALQKDTREWIMQQNIRHFYEGGEGVCHQVLPEQGFALPGKLIVGADSHSCTYGAFGAFGTGVGATDMAEIFASGKLWFRVPETIKMTVDGTLEKGVYAKDLTLYLIGKTGISGATYKAVEFYGTAVSDLSVSGRMTLCNMAIEMGAKTGIVPPDKKTFDFLQNRSMVDFEPAYADKDAVYCRENDFDAKDIEPQIACPHEVDNVVPISKVAGIH
ncbi:MAG: aconitase/3-isopropylmalate dehydratase large subunit family protein, partial [Methanimicrococcus sp.]|nr:aconitase/3-isopropylmalate dehydratase large subunit family protein [Methanimicrococcus sp.]